MDPNRDFPYLQNPSNCMKTTAARAVNEAWRSHLFQAAVTFHGGMQAVGYEWGSPNHFGAGGDSESPDDLGQRAIGMVMREAAGAFRGRDVQGDGYYPVDRINRLVYPVNGGMEDWAYAGSWDKAAVPVCKPPTFGGYPAEKTQYNDAMLRAFNILVETSDMKRPTEDTLGKMSLQGTGNEGDSMLVVEGEGDGHVPRNLRLSYAVLDLLEPYVHSTRLAASWRVLQAPASTGNAAAAAAGSSSSSSLFQWSVFTPSSPLSPASGGGSRRSLEQQAGSTAGAAGAPSSAAHAAAYSAVRQEHSKPLPFKAPPVKGHGHDSEEEKEKEQKQEQQLPAGGAAPDAAPATPLLALARSASFNSRRAELLAPIEDALSLEASLSRSSSTTTSTTFLQLDSESLSESGNEQQAAERLLKLSKVGGSSSSSSTSQKLSALSLTQQQAALNEAPFSGPTACFQEAESGSSDAAASSLLCTRYKTQYHQWIDAELALTPSSSPGDGAAAAAAPSSGSSVPAPSVTFKLGWDVGGAVTIDRTSALIGTWDARLPPSLLLEQWAGAQPKETLSGQRLTSEAVNAVSPSFLSLLQTQYGIANAEEAKLLGRYIYAWQLVLDGRLPVSELPLDVLLRHSDARSGVSRWVFGGLGTQPEPPAFSTDTAAAAGAGRGDSSSSSSSDVELTDLSLLQLESLQHASAAGTALTASAGPAGAPDLSHAPLISRFVDCFSVLLPSLLPASAQKKQGEQQGARRMTSSCGGGSSEAMAAAATAAGEAALGPASARFASSFSSSSLRSSSLSSLSSRSTAELGQEATASSNAGEDAPRLRSVQGFLIVPYAVVDQDWAQQNRPEPAGLPPQSHMVNARTNPVWRASNEGYRVRGRSQWVGEPIFLAVAAHSTAAAQKAVAAAAESSGASAASADGSASAPQDAVLCEMASSSTRTIIGGDNAAALLPGRITGGGAAGLSDSGPLAAMGVVLLVVAAAGGVAYKNGHTPSSLVQRMRERQGRRRAPAGTPAAGPVSTAAAVGASASASASVQRKTLASSSLEADSSSGGSSEEQGMLKQGQQQQEQQQQRSEKKGRHMQLQGIAAALSSSSSVGPSSSSSSEAVLSIASHASPSARLTATPAASARFSTPPPLAVSSTARAAASASASAGSGGRDRGTPLSSQRDRDSTDMSELTPRAGTAAAELTAVAVLEGGQGSAGKELEQEEEQEQAAKTPLIHTPSPARKQ